MKLPAHGAGLAGHVPVKVQNQSSKLRICNTSVLDLICHLNFGI
ncbi:MAG: hypothetical protein H6Q41_6035 [Deltaproteobacteria bacterium]|nr:hypothetical protein [Deltaproteobacteria bacterium]